MNDDWGAQLFFKLSARYGNTIYNFKGLSFHKSKYRGVERPLYFASNSLCPCSDIYLAFAAAGAADSCRAIFGKLVRGILAAGRKARDHLAQASMNGASKDSLVIGQNSQGVEIRGSLLRLTRYLAVFEVYNPSLVLQLSEVLGGFKIIINERAIYAGRAAPRACGPAAKRGF